MATNQAKQAKQNGSGPLRIVGIEACPTVRADLVMASGVTPDGTVQLELAEVISIPIAGTDDVERMLKYTGHLRMTTRVAAELARAIQRTLEMNREQRERRAAEAAAAARKPKQANVKTTAPN